MKRSIRVFILLLIFAAITQAQNQSPERDMRALTILKQSIQSSGGANSILRYSDYKASGMMTFYWAGQEVSGPVEIRGRGLHQVRRDVHLDDGDYSLVINNGAGKTMSPGRTVGIDAIAAADLEMLVTPIASLVSAVNDGTTSLALDGIERIGNTQAYSIRLIRPLNHRQPQSRALSALLTSHVYIDSTTFMIVGIRHSLPSKSRRSRVAERLVEFQGFRDTNGVVLPTVITETVFGQRTYHMQIESFEFNVGVPEEAFSIK